MFRFAKLLILLLILIIRSLVKGIESVSGLLLEDQLRQWIFFQGENHLHSIHLQLILINMLEITFGGVETLQGTFFHSNIYVKNLTYSLSIFVHMILLLI